MAITTNGGAGVTADAVATLSNKTLAAPVITGGVGITGTTTIAGDLTVTGTTTNINTTNLVVEDKNIVLADVATPTDVTADGGGITLKGATDKSLNWVDATDAWTSSEHLNLASGKSYYVNGTLLKDVSETLTNKTLTTPTINGPTITATGQTPVIHGILLPATHTIIYEGTTDDAFETTLTVVDPTADRTITFPNSTGTVALTSDITVTASSSNTLTNKSISLTTNTVTATLAELNTAVSDADVVSLAGSETLTNKTLTAPTINNAVSSYSVLKSPEERLTVSATAATGTVNFDVLTQGVLYYTTNASGNWTLNVRGDSTPTTLNSVLATGDSITIVFLVTQGSTAYYGSALTIDGNAVTPKYITGTAFSAGNASSIDSYVYTIIKTGSAAFTVLASQTKFA
jgi:hypothetical protein